jgi:hypothetical protein
MGRTGTSRRDHVAEDGLTPTPEDGWVTQPQRPPDSGSCILRARPQVRPTGAGKRKYPISSAALSDPGNLPLPSAFPPSMIVDAGLRS